MARPILLTATVSLVALAVAQPTGAQDRVVSYTLYGTPGLLEMPSAVSANDGEIAGTIGYFPGQRRYSFTFQVTDRLSGTFRYSGIEDFSLFGPRGDGLYYDRSFDLRYRLVDEGDYVPAVSIGLRDFLGTGTYSSEYLVATKLLSESVRVTAGIGWGRLGSYNGFENPLGLGDREGFEPGDEGGTVAVDSFFRGDAALFGGVEWAPTDRLTFKAEYSSDAYAREEELGLIEPDSPYNFGLVYNALPGVQLTAAYLYGAELAVGITATVNPNDRPVPGGLDDPPVPVAVRGADARAAQTWDRAALPETELRERLRQGFALEGIALDAVELNDRTARVRYTNARYRTEAQAMGRAARVMTALLPPSVEVFVMEPQRRGTPMSATVLRRSDLERYENEAGGSAATLQAAEVGPAGPGAGLVEVPRSDDRFGFRISPYINFLLFDGDQPINASVGIEASARYEISPSLVASGAVRYRITEGPDEDRPVEDPPLPEVRTKSELYAIDGNPGIEYLQFAHYGRVAPQIYSRVTFGYLERAFGGLSSELLWAPVARNYAVGAEVNYVQQRAFDEPLGFQDYDVVTGHVSLYYDFQNGFEGQVDAGRYLAGDWGTTFALDRVFDNGWRVGAYFTLTDVPFEDYGEGSFDKGIRFTVPVDFLLGRPTRREFNNTLSSLNRDGGARLEVQGRLYETLRGGQLDDISDNFGRFYR